jgi:hypothetical protein
MEKRRVYCLLFVSLLVLGISLSFVSGMSIIESIFGSGDGSTDFIKSLQESSFFSRLLLFSLVALIVYAVVSVVPFAGNNGWVSGAVAVVVGILATLYLDETEIATILLSYGALGITLTALVPFFIIIVLSKGLSDKGYAIWSKIIWVVFGVVTLVRWASVELEEIGTFGTIVYPAVLIGVLVMIAIEKKIWKLARKSKVDDTKDKAQEGAELAVAGGKAMATIAGGMGEAAEKAFKKKR